MAKHFVQDDTFRVRRPAKKASNDSGMSGPLTACPYYTHPAPIINHTLSRFEIQSPGGAKEPARRKTLAFDFIPGILLNLCRCRKFPKEAAPDHECDPYCSESDKHVTILFRHYM
jgi:hypothetical protein